MGQSLSTSIEINAPPEVVREAFLDFDSYQYWSRSSSLTLSLPPSSSTTQTAEILPGSKIIMEADETKISPRVVANSPEKFIWQGEIWPVLKARHTFRFTKGKEDGTTLLVQEEEFWGVLALLFSETWPAWGGGMRKGTVERFERWNGELKGWIEEGREARLRNETQ